MIEFVLKLPLGSRWTNVLAVLAVEYDAEFNLDNAIEPALIAEDNIGDVNVWLISVVLVVVKAFKYLFVVPWFKSSVVFVLKSIVNRGVE